MNFLNVFSQTNISISKIAYLDIKQILVFCELQSFLRVTKNE